MFLFSSGTMFLNTSLSPHILNKRQEGSGDVEAIVAKVAIIIFTLTVVFGLAGNAMVIWVAGFKLKVRLRCQTDAAGA